MALRLTLALVVAAAGAAAGAGAGARGRASSLRTNFPDNLMWMRYTQPRAILTSEHLEEPVTSALFAQRLDHLDPESSETWNQSYRSNNASYRGGGPAFVMLAGTSEADFLSDWLRSGHMADLARLFHADRFLFSMRFYTQPRPTVDARAASLKYLSTEQALQDVIALLRHLRDSGRVGRDQRVVLFGGGYAGSIATWARARFPELVHAAVVSGAITEPRIQLSAYFPTVTRALDVLHQKDLECKDNMEEAFLALESLLDTPEGRKTFNTHFKPCTPLAVDAVVPSLDRAQIVGLLASSIADMVQENVDSVLGDTLEVPCTVLDFLEPSPTALAQALQLSDRGKCVEYTFEGLVLQASDVLWENPQNKWGIRPWLWQQCTELGLFATSLSSSFPYSSRITMDFHKTLCSRVFKDRYDYVELMNNLRILLLAYKGKRPNVTNVIFIKGDLDPWKESSPDDSFNDVAHPVLTVRRASHAHDMFRRDDFDPPRLKSARKRVAATLRSWLTTNK